jgi:sodium/potassium-transporting ATPase subunit alpha
MFPALGLGAGKPEPGNMTRPPRSHQERLLNWRLLVHAYLFLGVLEAMVAMAAYSFVLQGSGWHWGESLEAYDPLYLQATTACFSAIIVTQIVNVFLCKMPGRSLFSGQLFDNRIILWGIALEIALVLVIDYTHWGNMIFGTAPIAAEVWLFVLPFALGMVLLEELRKFAVIRLSSEH